MFTENIQSLIINNLGLSGLIILIIGAGLSYLIIKVKPIWAKLLTFVILLIFAYFTISMIIDSEQNSPHKKTIPTKKETPCYITKVYSDVHVRREPKVVYPPYNNEIDTIIPPQDNITILHVTRSNQDIWYKISYTNKNDNLIEGWISGRYLTNIYGKYHLKKQLGGGHVRKQTSKNSPYIGYIKKNAKNILILIKKRNSETSTMWYKIKHLDEDDNEITGWVSGKILEKEQI